MAAADTSPKAALDPANEAGSRRVLHREHAGAGFAIAWHDFTAEEDFDWAESFHPETFAICLNVRGSGEVAAGARCLRLTPHTAGFYQQGKRRLKAHRQAHERHQFFTLEFSGEFLRRQLAPADDGLHPAVKTLLRGRAAAAVSEPVPLAPEQQQLALSLHRPPVRGAAQAIWYRAKALEIAARLLYAPAAGEELFCQRYQRQARERTQRVLALLNASLAAPPSLEEIGRQVGCSHFYLSRIFSQEMGCGIFQYLRRLRLVRAAELLREGRLNVTEVALAVGYATPSHFSAAFHEAFGCCPGLYPLRTLARVERRRSAGGETPGPAAHAFDKK